MIEIGRKFYGRSRHPSYPDTVKHSILLDKLNNLGLRGHMQSFLKSYLSKRQQCVISGNVYSNFAEVDYGVTQGSIL